MIHLSQANSSIIFEEKDETLSILHWGEKIGDLTAAGEKALSLATQKPHFHGGLDVSPRNLVLREHSRGFIGHPALRGHRSGTAATNRFVVKSATQKDQTLTALFVDVIAELEISMTYTLTTSDVLLIDSFILHEIS